MISVKSVEPVQSAATTPVEKGMVCTFYSYKGGVGRSMAMANVAEILADHGYPVIVCDWDLEAPGLERYLFDDAEKSKEYRKYPGIIDLVLEYKTMVSTQSTASPGPRESKGDDFQQIGDLWLRRPSSFAVPIPSPRRSGGSIRFLSAGRRDNEWDRKYNEAIRDMDWSEFYNAWSGDAYFEFFRKDLLGSGNIVLIDSRTGVTEAGGVCTHHLADLAVLFSAANDLNVDGTRWMAEILRSPELAKMRGSRGNVAVVPVAARIEQFSETDDLLAFRKRFRTDFARYLPESKTFNNRIGFLDETEIPYVPKFSLKEKIVSRVAPADRLATLYDKYFNLAVRIQEWGLETGRIEKLGDTSQIIREVSSSGLDAVGLVPKGKYFLSCSIKGAERAQILAARLADAKIDLWSDLLPGAFSGREPEGLQVQKAFARCNGGAILLISPEDSLEWFESELNLLLARRAVNPSYRTLVLVDGPQEFPQLASLLKRFPVLRLGPDLSNATSAIIAELLPESRSPSEGAPLGDCEITGISHARFLFDRETQTEGLLAKLIESLDHNKSTLILSGRHGSGKTALVFGSLFPAVLRGWVVGPRSHWSIVAFEPGELFSNGLQNRLPPSGVENLLAFMDNAESLLSLSEPEQIRAVTVLDSEFRKRASRFFLIVSVRSDALLDLRAGPFKTLLADSVGIYDVPPPDGEQLRAFVEGSMRMSDMVAESGLKERLIRDFSAETATFAEAQYVLRHLAKHRSGNTVTHAAYDQLGGLQGAILGCATEALESLSADRQVVATAVISELVNPITHERRFVPLNELTDTGLVREHPAAREVVEFLRQRKVISVNDNRMVGLVHEALIRSEPIQSWVTKNPALRLREELEAAAAVWDKNGRTMLPSLSNRYDGVSPRSNLGREFVEALAHKKAFSFRAKLVLAILALTSLIFGIVVWADLKSSRNENRLLRGEITKTRDELAESEKAKLTTYREIVDLQAEHVDLRAENAKLATALTNALKRAGERDEFEKKLAVARQETLQLTNDLRSARAQAADFAKQNEKARTEGDALRERLLQAQNELTRLTGSSKGGQEQYKLLLEQNGRLFQQIMDYFRVQDSQLKRPDPEWEKLRYGIQVQMENMKAANPALPYELRKYESPRQQQQLRK